MEIVNGRFNAVYILLAPVFLFKWNYFKNIYTFFAQKVCKYKYLLYLYTIKLKQRNYDNSRKHHQNNKPNNNSKRRKYG